MKILMLSHYFWPHGGGVEKHLAKLSQELIEDGHDITILTSQHQADLPQEENRFGLKIKRLNFSKSKFLGLVQIWWQLCWQRSFFSQFDLIHIHDVFLWFLPLRFLLPFKPVFMTFHGYASSPVRFKAKFWQWVSEKLTRGNICIGAFITQHFGTQADAVSYGAVEPTELTESANNKLEKVDYEALFIGRLSVQLALPIYLEAIEFLQQKGEFEVLFLGDGPEREQAEKVGVCRGWVESVAPFFEQSQFVFASSYLSILEAMSAGKLVFAAYNPTDQLKRDYLHFTPFSSWIIIVSSAQELVTKIEYYQAHPQQAQEKIKAAQAWAQQQTWSKLATTYQRLWSK